MSVTGYARVSTADQDVEIQVRQLREAGCSVVYADHASGGSEDRPEWLACKRSLGAGDVLVVTRLDRLGRSLKDLVGIIEELGARGVEFRSLSGEIDTCTPGGRMAFHVAAAFAEYERSLIRQRTLEGLDHARSRGVKFGRPRALSEEQVQAVVTLKAKGESWGSIARILGVSERTVRRAYAAWGASESV